MEVAELVLDDQQLSFTPALSCRLWVHDPITFVPDAKFILLPHAVLSSSDVLSPVEVCPGSVKGQNYPGGWERA